MVTGEEDGLDETRWAVVMSWKGCEEGCEREMKGDEVERVMCKWAFGESVIVVLVRCANVQIAG